MAAKLYKAADVRKVCPGVSLRKIDYWVSIGLIQPTRYIETRERGRTFFLFDFEAIVQIRLVQSLRSTGLSLQRIQKAVEFLKAHQAGKGWHSAFIVTDGFDLFEFTDEPDIVRSLAKADAGQLAFAVFAVGAARKHVQTCLRTRPPVDVDRYDGELRKWATAS